MVIATIFSPSAESKFIIIKYQGSIVPSIIIISASGRKIFTRALQFSKSVTTELVPINLEGISPNARLPNDGMLDWQQGAESSTVIFWGRVIYIDGFRFQINFVIAR